MSSTSPAADRRPWLQRALSRPDLVVAAAILVIVALAWSWLLRASGGAGAEIAGMPGMALHVAPWTPDYLLATFAMWAVMMTAMMLPSAAPMILLYARIDRAPSARLRFLHVALFLAAYLVVWTAFSAAAAAAQALLVGTGLVSAAALALGDRMIAAAFLIAAALYELTSAKRQCLANCQSPLLFLHRHFRPGAGAAFRLGLRHGFFCLGCCIALMLLLFVGGVMNLLWVAALAILVLAQKLAPPRWRLDRWSAAVLAAAAVAMLVSR